MIRTVDFTTFPIRTSRNSELKEPDVHISLDIVTSHNGARFAIPYAKPYCTGFGYDIGAGKREWAFPGAIPIDPKIEISYKERREITERVLGRPQKKNEGLVANVFDAYALPACKVDYIFSSHCLEHLYNPYVALNLWYNVLHETGVLFLYLPSYKNVYWRPWNNKKHIHVMDPVILKDCLTSMGFRNIFVSGVDLNESFMIIASK